MLNINNRIDAHIHYGSPLAPETLIGFMDKTGIDMANLVLVPHRQRLTAVPEAMMAKASYPGRFYAFTSLDVSEYYRHSKNVGKYMAAFDTIQYSIAYALIPVFIGFGINIRQVGLFMAPLALTMVIAIVLIKENSSVPGAVAKYGDNAGEVLKEKPIGVVEGLQMTLGNKAFRAWLVIHGCFNLGLQMFLSGQNVLISGPMGLNGFQIAIINTTAFAPVPIMLILYRKVMAKKGYRFAFQTALASFALGMLFMCLAYVRWFPDATVRMILGATGGVISSYGIGAFFSAPTAMPTQIAAEEKKRTGKSHPSMYFAVQGIVNSIVAAVGPGLIWVNLRNVSVGGNDLFGTHAMTYIVMIFCVLAILACNLLPKEYDQLGKK